MLHWTWLEARENLEMISKNRCSGWAAALAIIPVTVLMSATLAVAQVEVLHNFGQGNDGLSPWGSLTIDSSGNLYGTALSGGTYNAGIVFELIPTVGGSWTETVLHEFGSGTDGHDPRAGLVFDPAGNLYGTTNEGGHYQDGTVFKLSPTVGGGWTETVLHEFSGTDGNGSHAGLILDAAGNLYGTTYSGGAYGFGEAFELMPQKGGAWTLKILHSFGHGKDGAYCEAGLTFDAAGHLYGTTSNGGAYNQGTVFKLTSTAGTWSEQVLHSFNPNSTDGYQPNAGLILDAAGDLFGTADEGGMYGYGAVFELLPRPGGLWAEKLLHHFTGAHSDGTLPYGGLIFDALGNLYGTTLFGGATVPGHGTVFELTPGAGGVWTHTTLTSFNGSDGYLPYAGLVFDAAGNLYGTTSSGGAFQQGTAFEIKR
jgi:uncharacterized repeat protein (TIGR03803 family)